MSNYSEKEYNDALNAIFTRFPSIQNVGFGAKEGAYKPGLEHMLKFESILGNPHEDWRSIHVAGTNGKGSVANMLASVLGSTGLKVGLYTSPHLVDFRERMRVWVPDSAASGGGHTEMAPKEYVFDFLKRYKADFESLDLSFFEITTGMAFKWFSDIHVDVAVVEVGLGGRLDSTNIITPALSIVTSIGMDHCDLLGHTLAAIAGEKAGIFKKGVPALVGEYLPETRPVFEAKAKDFCPLTFAQDVVPSLWNPDIPKNMDLQGWYQEKNLRTVLAAVDILMNMSCGAGGLAEYSRLKDGNMVANALEHTASRMDFHGRWERVSSRPLVIADIGHNPPALKENFDQLKSMLNNGECDSLIIVYAVMADKDLSRILPLMPENATYVFTAPAIKRALPVDELYSTCREYWKEHGRNTERLHVAQDVSSALQLAVSLSGEAGKPLVYVGGSSYLVSEAEPLMQDFLASGFIKR
ncbi:MAG: bifunctional folylpolyglutamate synthase/dihydrofolate synthase [Bacteroidales bacterium]|jgi:dihydrofolate synthase/folylpolyglutamate synthase|nr:bifunctional folylpolyglutamate synthase/dihydrofolate synthase [Bacteroidales bacterium]MCI2133302.1 bifunctional folylpolyglutamate synthase/dihydrofolate synthase [Bacteroidales bacterium]